MLQKRKKSHGQEVFEIRAALGISYHADAIFFVGKQPQRLIDRYSNTSACGSQHGKGHLKLLVLHPVQVVHVLGVDVVWLIMSVRPHPPYASRLECTRS